MLRGNNRARENVIYYFEFSRKCLRAYSDKGDYLSGRWMQSICLQANRGMCEFRGFSSVQGLLLCFVCIKTPNTEGAARQMLLLIHGICGMNYSVLSSMMMN